MRSHIGNWSFRVGLALLLALVLACRTKVDSDVKGLDPDDSNISAPVEVRMADVEQIRLIPHWNVPKGILMSLTTNNSQVVYDFYKIIEKINEMDRLRGLDGPEQEITLVLVYHQEELYQRFAERIDASDPNGEFSYLKKIRLNEPIDLWMQDWGEFAAMKVSGREWLGVLDLGRGLNLNLNLRQFAGIFETPITYLRGNREDSGTYGGNIEPAASGYIIYGDKLRDFQFQNRLLDKLARDRHDRPKAIRLGTSWLSVGHVDEIFTFVPASNHCKSALAVGSPVEALNILLQAHGHAYHGTNLPDQEFLWRTAKFFLNNRDQSPPYRLSDFNLDLVRRDSTPENEFLRAQLESEMHIQESLESIYTDRSELCLVDIFRIPQLFYRHDTGMRPYLPSPANSLFLRDHAVIPQQKKDANSAEFAPIAAAIKAQFSLRTGSPLKVHTIDMNFYHERQGAVHCGTNVVREPSMEFKPPQSNCYTSERDVAEVCRYKLDDKIALSVAYHGRLGWGFRERVTTMSYVVKINGRDHVISFPINRRLGLNRTVFVSDSAAVGRLDRAAKVVDGIDLSSRLEIQLAFSNGHEWDNNGADSQGPRNYKVSLPPIP